MSQDGGLAGNADRLRWNAKYSGGFVPSFAPHPLAVRALAMDGPAGPMLDLACGASGSALHAAAAGRFVTAVDVSDVALGLLAAAAERRGLSARISLVQADLATFVPHPLAYALVLCAGFWDRGVFAVAVRAVAPGGLIGWEALTADAMRLRPGLPPGWCVTGDEPASLLPAGFGLSDQHDIAAEHGAKRLMLARRGR